MSYVCLWSPDWPTGAAFPAELTAALLQHTPHIVVAARGRVWADARGFEPATLAAALLQVVHKRGFVTARAGTATTVIAAELAATRSSASPLTIVRPGTDRAFLAPLSVHLLQPSALVALLLDGIGIETCGALAALDAEHVEVRLGADGVRSWKLARGDDPRLLFGGTERALPSTSIEWVEYALRDAERLFFVINALTNNICIALGEQERRAREMSLIFTMAGRADFIHPLRSARPTASQKGWMRLIRTTLDRVTLPDAVIGVTLRVETATENDSVQGDLFDRGFASAPAVERTVSQLMDDQGDVVLTPKSSAHPLIEARTTWRREDPAIAAESGVLGVSREEQGITPTARLTLQLVTPPRRVTVETEVRRDHESPTGYHDGNAWYTIVDAAGPECVLGGEWQVSYAREYFRCVREDGTLVWLYRDVREVPAGDEDAITMPNRMSEGQPRHIDTVPWYLHGWWD